MSLAAHQTLGNTTSGKLSNASYDMDGMTMFFVYHAITTYSGDTTLFSLYGYDYDDSQLLGPLKSGATIEFRSNIVSDTDGDGGLDSDDEVRPFLGMSRGSDNGSSEPTLRQWDTYDLDAELSVSGKFRYMTCVIDGQTSTTTSAPYLRSGRLYKNGDDSKGIGPTTNTSVSNTNDQQDTAQSKLLNLGVDGLMRPSAVTIGARNVINALTGSYGTPDRHLKAQQVYEVIYYKKVLNDEELTAVENYIVEKYGTPP